MSLISSSKLINQSQNLLKAPSKSSLSNLNVMGLSKEESTLFAKLYEEKIKNYFPFLNKSLLSAFKPINCSNVHSIFQNPSIYQKAINISENFGLKFHILCKECKEGVFSVNNPILRFSDLKMVREKELIFFPRKEKKSQNFTLLNSRKKRKMDRDCIHKKIKARLFKYIKDRVKNCVVEGLSGLKIPQKIVSDVTLEFNRNLLNCKVGSIFVESNLYFSSRNQISEIVKPGKKEELQSFLFKSIEECIEDYLQSKVFETDLRKFDNEGYAETFGTYIKEFVQYYNDDSIRKKKRDIGSKYESSQTD